MTTSRKIFIAFVAAVVLTSVVFYWRWLRSLDGINAAPWTDALGDIASVCVSLLTLWLVYESRRMLAHSQLAFKAQYHPMFDFEFHVVSDVRNLTQRDSRVEVISQTEGGESMHDASRGCLIFMRVATLNHVVCNDLMIELEVKIGKATYTPSFKRSRLTDKPIFVYLTSAPTTEPLAVLSLNKLDVWYRNFASAPTDQRDQFKLPSFVPVEFTGDLVTSMAYDENIQVREVIERIAMVIPPLDVVPLPDGD